MAWTQELGKEQQLGSNNYSCSDRIYKLSNGNNQFFFLQNNLPHEKTHASTQATKNNFVFMFTNDDTLHVAVLATINRDMKTQNAESYV